MTGALWCMAVAACLVGAALGVWWLVSDALDAWERSREDAGVDE